MMAREDRCVGYAVLTGFSCVRPFGTARCGSVLIRAVARSGKGLNPSLVNQVLELAGNGGNQSEFREYWEQVHGFDERNQLLQMVIKGGSMESTERCVFIMVQEGTKISVDSMRAMVELARGDVASLLAMFSRCRSSTQPVRMGLYMALLESVNGRARAEQVVDEIEMVFGCRTRTSLVLLFKKCADEGDRDSMVRILQDFSRLQYRIDEEVYLSLLRTMHKACGSREEAVAKLLLILKRNRLLDSKSVEQIGKAHLNGGELHLLQIISQNCVLEGRLASIMVHACAEKDDLMGAEMIVDELERSQHRFDATDIFAYNALLESYAKAGDLEMVNETFGKIRRSANLKPNAKTFHILINAFRADGDLSGCEATVESMINHGIKPKSGIFNTMLKSYAECEDEVGFEQCLRRMSRSRIAPNQVTHSIVISSYSKLGYPEKGEKWFKRILERKILPDTVVCTSLMQLRIEDNRLTDAVEVLLKTMPELGVEPDDVSYRAVVRALVGKNHMQHARLLAKEARDRGIFVFVPRRNTKVGEEYLF
uniref:Pentacotripeptide-repeat region of PRORP domain-containing protein n=1 Tax=Rhodosorus marinus TaxID=101924 RepID=A0A7S2Z9I4_9RHOD|mmetsp:Transcript_10874/g.45223  ORF Transcript_10874/g.45223 Transcript_10874/m.45223 type:complete len:539 (+) Transcript_10874:51-1667(+)